MKVDEMGGVRSTHGTNENAYKFLVAKPVGKIPLRRPRRKCNYIIRMDLMEMEREVVDWIHLAQDMDK
jgi:hypothetical protein